MAVLLAAAGGRATAQSDATTAKSASTVLAEAQQQAKQKHKNVFLHFSASWCGWCHKLEAAMNSPELKHIFTDNYVLAELDIDEDAAHKAQENPGAKELNTQWGGEKSGIPFIVWLDASGKRLADSNVMPKGANIGYPAEPEEIEAFMALVRKTAPKITATDFAMLKSYLVAHAPKPQAH
jgi:thiol:disulfide interchange protein